MNETREDKVRERIILRNYAAHLDMTHTKLVENNYAIDAVVHEGRAIKAWVELKCRGATRSDSYLCSLSKLLRLRTLSHGCKIPAYFLVVTPTESVQLRVGKHPIELGRLAMGGSSRGQAGDYEPCVFLPRTSFEDITSWRLWTPESEAELKQELMEP